ncbi:MAG: acyl-CoA synthetase, partial [Chryseolinea sp.]
DSGTREKLKLFRCQFYATYGMTETVSHIALQKLNGPSSSEFFQTLSGVEIKLDDRNCLIIKAPYLKEVIHTNDIAEIISPKDFKWIGRYDNVINSGGVKVSPENIELAIEKIFQDAGVSRSFFIAGVSDQRLGQKILLVIEGERLENTTIEKIISMFKHTLSVYEIPKEIVFKKEFVVTETGKINRIKTIEFIENQL